MTWAGTQAGLKSGSPKPLTLLEPAFLMWTACTQVLLLLSSVCEAQVQFWSQDVLEGALTLCAFLSPKLGNTLPAKSYELHLNGTIARDILCLVTNTVEIPRRLFYLPSNKILKLFFSYCQPKESEI